MSERSIEHATFVVERAYDAPPRKAANTPFQALYQDIVAEFRPERDGTTGFHRAGRLLDGHDRARP